MFAKLKKKIQEEGGISAAESSDKNQPGAAVGDGVTGTKSQPNLSYIHNSDYQPHKRTSSLSLDSELTNRDRDSSRDKPQLTSSTDMIDSASKEDLADLLMRRTNQVKIFEAKLSEMTSLVREKNQQIEKLETELEKQQDSLCQRLQDLNEQYHSNRAKLSENISSAVKKREEEMRLEIQDLEKAKVRLEERLMVVEMEKDRFSHKTEESEALEKAAEEERSKLKSLLFQSQIEVDQFKKILSEKSSDRIEKKDLLDQISVLTQQKNEAERNAIASENLASSLKSSNERLEKLLKESTDAYAQMALQNSQDDWLEKQIESERTITRLEGEIGNLKAELSAKSRENSLHLNQLNERTKQLSESKAQVESLEADLRLQTLKVRELEQLCEKSNAQLADTLKDKESFRQRSDELSRLCDALRLSHDESKTELESTVKQRGETMLALERQMSEQKLTLEVTQQKLSELQELKSVEHQVFETEEITRLREELAECQASFQEKLKIIKKQDQRLADLKKLLQRELKVNSDQPTLPSANGNNYHNSIDSVLKAYDSSDATAAPSSYGHSSLGASVAATLPISHSLTHNDMRNIRLVAEDIENAHGKDVLYGANAGGVLQRFNPQGVREEDREYDFTRELNFKYLRHVVLKFMLSRETEAIQLIKAVSMLLNFTTEEQKLIKETLEWKMSWFGARPQLPMKGQTAKVIPPSF